MNFRNALEVEEKIDRCSLKIMGSAGCGKQTAHAAMRRTRCFSSSHRTRIYTVRPFKRSRKWTS